jgi:hypothetical protein
MPVLSWLSWKQGQITSYVLIVTVHLLRRKLTSNKSVVTFSVGKVTSDPLIVTFSVGKVTSSKLIVTFFSALMNSEIIGIFFKAQ